MTMTSERPPLTRSQTASIAFLATCVSVLFGAAVPDLLIPMPPAKVQMGDQGQSALENSRSPLVRMLEASPVHSSLSPAVGTQIPPIDVQQVKMLYRDLGYDLDTVATANQEVPRVFLTSVPNGLTAINDTELRKVVFLRTLLPLILKVNEDILADRERVKAIAARQAQGGRLHITDRDWLESISTAYGLSQPDTALLLRRMDVIPPSLALAQSAEESGWGTSRFARQGNALFGQWTWDHSQGIRPNAAGPSATHAIRRFPSLLAAVRAYARNLNTHRAYAAFRLKREELREGGQALSGAVLAQTLTRYSQRGNAYVRSLQTIMNANDLAALDKARLSRAPVEMASLETRPQN
jgi:Bax protein